MTTDRISEGKASQGAGASHQAAGEGASSRGGGLRAPAATPPPTPGNRVPQSSLGEASHTLSPLGDPGLGGPAAEVGTSHGVGGEVIDWDELLDEGEEVCPACRGTTIDVESQDCSFCFGSGVI